MATITYSPAGTVNPVSRFMIPPVCVTDAPWLDEYTGDSIVELIE
jgi:hypothetical protein